MLFEFAFGDTFLGWEVPRHPFSAEEFIKERKARHERFRRFKDRLRESMASMDKPRERQPDIGLGARAQHHHRSQAAGPDERHADRNEHRVEDVLEISERSGGLYGPMSTCSGSQTSVA